MERTSRPRRRLAGAVAALTLFGLGACTSQPSAKAVAEDIVEGLPADILDAGQRECLLERLDAYSSDELTAIGEDNEEINFDAEDAVAQGTDAYQAFVADLRECMS